MKKEGNFIKNPEPSYSTSTRGRGQDTAGAPQGVKEGTLTKWGEGKVAGISLTWEDPDARKALRN